MSPPPVSVVVPARNAAPAIGRTLESLGPAADLVREIILIDDGSTDGTVGAAELACQTANLPLRVVKGEARGVSAARNLGLEEATGDLLYLIDADDRVIADGLRALVETLVRRPEVDLVVGVALDNRDGRVQPHRPQPFKRSPLGNAEDYIRYDRALFRPGSVVVRSALVEDRRFIEGLPYQEDGIFWASVLTRATPEAIDAPVIEYFIDERRTEARICDGHRSKFLKLLSALRTLAPLGVSRAAIRSSAGANALTLARKLVRRGELQAARRYLRLAWGASDAPRHRYAVFKARTKLVLARLTRALRGA